MWSDDMFFKATLTVCIGLGGVVLIATGALHFIITYRKWRKGFLEDATGLTGEEGTSRRFPKMDSDPFEKLKNVVSNHGITLDEHKKLLEEYGEDIAEHESAFRLMEEQSKGRTALLDERLQRIIADIEDLQSMSHASMTQATGANRSLQNGILSDIKEIKDAISKLLNRMAKEERRE